MTVSLEIRAIDVIEQMIAAGWKINGFGGSAKTATTQTMEIVWEREEPKP